MLDVPEAASIQASQEFYLALCGMLAATSSYKQRCSSMMRVYVPVGQNMCLLQAVQLSSVGVCEDLGGNGPYERVVLFESHQQ
jgi:hypothetical protein